MTAIWAGGLESFALSIAKSLQGKGYSFRVYSWTGDDTWTEPFDVHGIEIIPLGGPKRIHSPMDAARFVLAWIRMVRRFRADRISILHTHDFLPSLLGRTAAIAAGVPFRVVTFHNLYDWWPGWAHRTNRVLQRWTSATTCVSESVNGFMSKEGGLDPRSMRTVLNGVDETVFRPSGEARQRIRAELGLSDQDILVGSVGSITTRKAQWILVEALSKLVEEGHGIQARIWGANSDNPQHAEKDLLALIRSKGLEPHITLLPPRRDIQDVYNAMDIHCMTSRTEGLSLASVEAMMCGVLPVYSDIGPFREVVEDGQSGYLFRSGDPEDLARVLRDLLTGKTPNIARDRIASIARERFGLQRMVQQYRDIYGRAPAR